MIKTVQKRLQVSSNLLIALYLKSMEPAFMNRADILILSTRLIY